METLMIMETLMLVETRHLIITILMETLMRMETLIPKVSQIFIAIKLNIASNHASFLLGGVNEVVPSKNIASSKANLSKSNVS